MVLNSFGAFVKAKQHLEKAVMIAREFGDVEGERIFHTLKNMLNKAIEYYERTPSKKKN